MGPQQADVISASYVICLEHDVEQTHSCQSRAVMYCMPNDLVSIKGVQCSSKITQDTSAANVNVSS